MWAVGRRVLSATGAMEVASVAVHELGDAELRFVARSARRRRRALEPVPHPALRPGHGRPPTREPRRGAPGRRPLRRPPPHSQNSERVALPVGEPMNDAQALLAPSDLEFDPRRLVRELGVRDWRFNHLLPTARYSAVRALVAPVADDRHDGWARCRSRLRGTRSSSVLTDREPAASGIRSRGRPGTPWSAFPDATLLDTLDSVEVVALPAPQRARPLHGLLASHRPARAPQDRFRSGMRGRALVSGPASASGCSTSTCAGRVLHSWFSAYNPDYSKFSPGLVLLLEHTNTATTHGIRLIDLGRGNQDYKRHIYNGTSDVGEGQVPRRSFVAEPRCSLVTPAGSFAGWRRCAAETGARPRTTRQSPSRPDDPLERLAADHSRTSTARTRARAEEQPSWCGSGWVYVGTGIATEHLQVLTAAQGRRGARHRRPLGGHSALGGATLAGGRGYSGSTTRCWRPGRRRARFHATRPRAVRATPSKPEPTLVAEKPLVTTHAELRRTPPSSRRRSIVGSSRTRTTGGMMACSGRHVVESGRLGEVRDVEVAMALAIHARRARSPIVPCRPLRTSSRGTLPATSAPI